MLAVSPRLYAQAAWQLFQESAASERLTLLDRVAQDLVRRYKRPARERILKALAREEAAAQGIPPVRAWAASEAVAQALRRLFENKPLTVTLSPQLQKGVILEQSEWRVDASLRGRLLTLKRELISA